MSDIDAIQYVSIRDIGCAIPFDNEQYQYTKKWRVGGQNRCVIGKNIYNGLLVVFVCLHRVLRTNHKLTHTHTPHVCYSDF